MNDLSKIATSHLSRAAYIYLRQSSAAQVEHNRESTQRQYAFHHILLAGLPAHFAVGTAIAGRPPHRSGLAQLRHPAPTLGV